LIDLVMVVSLYGDRDLHDVSRVAHPSQGALESLP
jgi:hypothetical protein